VVIMNVVPGVVIALLIFVFLGTMRLGGTKARGYARPGRAVPARLFPRPAGAVPQPRADPPLGSSAFRSMTQNALLTFLPVYLAYEMAIRPSGWAPACSRLQTAGFAAAPVAGHLSDRMGRKSVMMTSMAMTAVVLVFMALAGKSLAFVFFVAVLGFFLYAIRPVLQAWLLESTPATWGGRASGSSSARRRSAPPSGRSSGGWSPTATV